MMKLKELLRQYDNRHFQVEPGDKKIFTREEAIRKIKDLFLELIGEDEDTQWSETARNHNQLRAELRKRVEKL